MNLLQGVPLPLLGREEGGGSDDEASVTTAIIGQATRACSTSSVGLGDGLCLEDAWFRMHAVRRATGGEKHGHIAIVEDMRGVTAFVHSGSVMISPPRPSLTADLSISPAVLSGEPHSLMSYIDVDPAAFTCDSVEYKWGTPPLHRTPLSSHALRPPSPSCCPIRLEGPEPLEPANPHTRIKPPTHRHET